MKPIMNITTLGQNSFSISESYLSHLNVIKKKKNPLSHALLSFLINPSESETSATI